MEIWYDKEEDVLNFELVDGEYWKSVELGNGVTADISKDGAITGIEILNASSVFSGDTKKVIDKAKVKA